MSFKSAMTCLPCSSTRTMPLRLAEVHLTWMTIRGTICTLDSTNNHSPLLIHSISHTWMDLWVIQGLNSITTLHKAFRYLIRTHMDSKFVYLTIQVWLRSKLVANTYSDSNQTKIRWIIWEYIQCRKHEWQDEHGKWKQGIEEEKQGSHQACCF